MMNQLLTLPSGLGLGLGLGLELGLAEVHEVRTQRGQHRGHHGQQMGACDVANPAFSLAVGTVSPRQVSVQVRGFGQGLAQNYLDQDLYTD